MKNRDSRGRNIFRSLLLASATSSAAIGASAVAQTAPAPADAGTAVQEEAIAEIIVTARKRSETLISVPAAISAVTGETLSRSGVNGVDGIARMVPGLLVGEGGGTTQGGTISLRGISASDSNPLGDQAVSFNIDGVQIARASVRRMGDFDITQVEILKGPQALFYGKNSPGGIISYRTADPTDKFEVGGNLGYEFVGHEIRGQGYVSGPIADGIGVRLAGYGSDMRGWVKNVLPSSNAYAPKNPWGPKNHEYALRGTLKFDQGGPLTARIKLSYNHAINQGMTANYQIVNCPTGTPMGTGLADDCKADDRLTTGTLGTELAGLDGVASAGIVGTPTGDLIRTSMFGDGEPYGKQEQWLAGGELNYEITPELTLSSVTGFYDLYYLNRGNFTQTSLPKAILASLNALKIREISEEVRLTSSFDGPINFMFGGQYQNSKAKTASLAVFGVAPGTPSIVGAPSPFVAQKYYYAQSGWAYSVYTQVQIKPVEQLEISLGGRLSNENKRLTSVLVRDVQQINLIPALSNGLQSSSFDDFSPEVTLTYRPSPDLTAYATYKQGFLSGGYNGGAGSAAAGVAYNPEKVKGWEGGIKARTPDGSLRAELALYSYDITDLQVQVTTQGTTQVLTNAGQVSSKGVEFSLNYRPPVDGLSLFGNVAYAKGRYDQYYATCYAGQATLAPGTGIGHCASQPNPTRGNVVGLIQNLSGTELLRSPKWTGNAGFVYDAPIAGSLNVEFSGDVSYSSSYITNPSSQPNSRQPHYALLNASLRLHTYHDKWEVALIGRNLTEKYYFLRGTDTPLSLTGPTRLADTIAVPSRGREIMLRFGFKY